MIVAVPAYLNGFAAIPLVGELIAIGMAPGAALAFLVAGGMTSLPAPMAVFARDRFLRSVRRCVFLGFHQRVVDLLRPLRSGAGADPLPVAGEGRACL